MIDYDLKIEKRKLIKNFWMHNDKIKRDFKNLKNNLRMRQPNYIQKQGYSTI